MSIKQEISNLIISNKISHWNDIEDNLLKFINQVNGEEYVCKSSGLEVDDKGNKYAHEEFELKSGAIILDKNELVFIVNKLSPSGNISVNTFDKLVFFSYIDAYTFLHEVVLKALDS